MRRTISPHKQVFNYQDILEMKKQEAQNQFKIMSDENKKLLMSHKINQLYENNSMLKALKM